MTNWIKAVIIMGAAFSWAILCLNNLVLFVGSITAALALLGTWAIKKELDRR